MDHYSSLLDDVQESQNALLDETKAAHGLLIELQSVLLTGGEESNDDSFLSAGENEGGNASTTAASHEQVRALRRLY